MPGTHLLPPNLLKLFAPRPPLPYARPVDKDVDRVTTKNVDGVGSILLQLKEATTAGLISAGEGEGMEEGEELIFTHAEEIKRQIRREERKKKRAEEFRIAKETCKFMFTFSSPSHIATCNMSLQISPRTTLRQLVILTKLCSYLVW